MNSADMVDPLDVVLNVATLVDPLDVLHQLPQKAVAPLVDPLDHLDMLGVLQLPLPAVPAAAPLSPGQKMPVCNVDPLELLFADPLQPHKQVKL